MMKKNNIFIFYLLLEGGIGVTFNKDVYAFTNDPEIAYNFSKTRNMDVFVCKTHKITESEYNIFLKNYMKEELSMHESYTKTKKSIQTINIALTRREKTMIRSDISNILYEKILEYMTWNTEIIKKKYRDSLDKLLYFGNSGFEFEDDVSSTERESKIIPNDLNYIIDRYGVLFGLDWSDNS